MRLMSKKPIKPKKPIQPNMPASLVEPTELIESNSFIAKISYAKKKLTTAINAAVKQQKLTLLEDVTPARIEVSTYQIIVNVKNTKVNKNFQTQHAKWVKVKPKAEIAFRKKETKFQEEMVEYRQKLSDYVEKLQNWNDQEISKLAKELKE